MLPEEPRNEQGGNERASYVEELFLKGSDSLTPVTHWPIHSAVKIWINLYSKWIDPLLRSRKNSITSSEERLLSSSASGSIKDYFQ